MNHTERLAETARRHRYLTRRLVRDAVETYLELLAEDIASGEWVDIYGIGKLQVNIEGGTGAKELRAYPRLRTKNRLGETFKQQCYARQK